MLTPKAFTLALMGGGVKDQLVPSPQPRTSLVQMASRYLMRIGSPELYYLEEETIRSNPIPFPEYRIVVGIENITEITLTTTPTVTKNLPRDIIPSPTVDDPAFEWSWAIFPEVDFSAHLATLSEHLIISPFLFLFIVIFGVIITPAHSLLSCFINLEPIGEILDVLDFVAEYRYAITFWLILVLRRPVEFLIRSFASFVVSVSRKAHNATHAGEELKTRLRRAEGKARGHSILLKDLGLAKDAHNAALSSHNGKILDIEAQMNGVTNAIIQYENDFGQLGGRMADAEDRFYALENFVTQEAGPMVIEFMKTEIDRTTNTFSHELKDITYRIQSLESEVNELKSSIKAKDDEIEALKIAPHDAQRDKVGIEALATAVSDSRKEKASLEEFYRNHNFNNLNANEYYRKVLADNSPGQVTPLMIAYQKAVYMQVSSTTEMMRRISGGQPATPQHMGRVQNFGGGIPGRYPSSNISPNSFGAASSPIGSPSGSPASISPPKRS